MNHLKRQLLCDSCISLRLPGDILPVERHALREAQSLSEKDVVFKLFKKNSEGHIDPFSAIN